MAPESKPCPRCGHALALGARFCAACGLPLARLEPGEVLDGKYEVLDKIAEGGMGEVYRARHVHLDEIRIIKITKPGALGQGGDRRFQEEARLASLVRHPNVAALYDFSRRPDGAYYIVWEFIDGETLEARLRRAGPLSPEDALSVARQVLAGLSEIHAQGIVHRDLSPDNIMLRGAAGGRLQAKIIDLGIAKRVAAESLQMTGTGLFLGKLKYCSPEQAGALPPGEAVDARSDLYSFGVVLYEMLAGKAPFESPTPEGYIGKHLHAAPPPLDASRLPRALAPGLSAAVAKALEKKRERRYRDAREFSDALERLAPALDSPEPPAASEPRSRRPAAKAALAALVLAAAAGAALYLVEHPRPAGRAAARPFPVKPAPTPSPALGSRGEAVAAAPGLAEEALRRAQAEQTQAVSAVPKAPRLETTPDASGAGAPSATEVRRALALWRARPEEARARRASEFARLASRFVQTHPDDPLAAQIQAELPAFLRKEAASALDRAQPLLAALYLRAYKNLSFAPPVPDLARRIERTPP